MKTSNFGAKVAILCLLGSLVACGASNNKLLATGLGTAIGAGAGFGIGKAIGGRNADWIGAATGAVVGGLVGNAIGSYLDERDQQTAAAANNKALNTPPGSRTSSVTWNSDHNPGVGGQTTVVATGQDNAGRECKKLREVAIIHGREVMDEGTHCRDPNGGGWVRIS